MSTRSLSTNSVEATEARWRTLSMLWLALWCAAIPQQPQQVARTLPNVELRLRMAVDRFRLFAGPYTAPPFKLGDVVADQLRGDVRITAISDGRIQWPKGRRLDQTGGHAGADAGRCSHATPETWISGRAKAGDHGWFRVGISRIESRTPRHFEAWPSD